MFIRQYGVCFGIVLALNHSQAGQQPIPKAACSATNSFSLVENLLAHKGYGEAARALDQLRACPGLSPLELFEMGWLYGRARQFKSALALFDSVPPIIPNRLTHGYAIALSKFELADYRGAITALEQLHSSDLLDTKSSNLLAVSYAKLTLYKEAYSVLNEQLKKEPNNANTFLNLITVCAEGGDYASAAEFGSQAVTKFPGSAEILLVRGAAYALLGRPDQAREDFAAAARLEPKRPDARFFLALTEYNQARYADALGILKQADQDGLQDPDLYYLRAETLLKTDPGNLSPVFRELNQALHLNAGSTAARTLRGRLLFEKGELQEAVADLEWANHDSPGSRSTIYNLARAYRALGKKDEAAMLFRQLTTGNGDILQEMGTRRLSETLAEKGAPQ